MQQGVVQAVLGGRHAYAVQTVAEQQRRSIAVASWRADGRAHDLEPFRPVPLVHGPELVAAAAHPVSADSLELHANVKTFLEATIGTSLPLGLVNVAAAIRNARVHLLVLHCSLEEALAAFAGEQAVVVAADLVAANGT